MPTIYVNTDNSDLKAKIYNASKIGKSAAAAEDKMQETVVAAIAKEGDFTTDKSVSSKGYTIRITVTKVEKSGGNTTYTLHPEIVRYPKTTGKGGKGELMVSTVTKDPTFTVQGNYEADILDGVKMVTENIVKVSIPHMRIDMMKR